MTTAPDPGEAAREEARARRQHLFAAYGVPERIAESDALAQAAAAGIPVDPTATADDVYASVYRDAAAADGWLNANLLHHGHPTLARVPLPDGRVIGILDLRPAFRRIREEQGRDPDTGIPEEWS